MGATTFMTFVRGTEPRRAFQEAKEDAAYRNGHDGYTGTIAEKHDYVVIQRAPVSRKEASTLAEHLIHAEDRRIDDKWGPAGCIPVASDNAFSLRSFRIKLDLDPLAFPDNYVDASKLRPKVVELAQAKLKEGERVLDFKVIADDKKFRVEVERAQGKGETRYCVVRRGDAPDWKRGHPSLAAARAHLTKHLQEIQEDHWGVLGYEVVGIVRRDSGAGLVSGRRVIKKRVVTVEVEVSKQVKTPTVEGFLFFGWASE